jgi:hypothetical protein
VFWGQHSVAPDFSERYMHGLQPPRSGYQTKIGVAEPLDAAFDDLQSINALLDRPYKITA